MNESAGSALLTTVLDGGRLARTARARVPLAASRFWESEWAMLAFAGAQAPLALCLSRSATLSGLHALATLAVGLYFAVSKSRKIASVAYVAAYATGAEVLWRMTDAPIFWEYGKYAVSAMMIVALARRGRSTTTPLPVLYFALLLPSVALTVTDSALGDVRQLLSTSMAGPFSLAVAACFFSQTVLGAAELRRLLLALVGPVIGVATLAIAGIASADRLVFTDESSLAASGGFGPNQVSSMLGLGALVCFLLLVERTVEWRVKPVLAVLLLAFGAQSALTFSRGGLYDLGVAVALAAAFLCKDVRTRVRFLVACAVVVTASYFVVLPALEGLTNGALSERFGDTTLTKRGDIAMLDIQIWADHPVLGVGPGMATSYRDELGMKALAHTEFTRLLAEHGVFGLSTILVLAAAVVANVRRAPTAARKAFSVACMAWSSAYMTNAAMRLVVPSFVFALAFAAAPGVGLRRPRESPRADAGRQTPR